MLSQREAVKKPLRHPQLCQGELKIVLEVPLLGRLTKVNPSVIVVSGAGGKELILHCNYIKEINNFKV